MSSNIVNLRPVSREDIPHISIWLNDNEICEAWFGRYSYGNPAHLGYDPETVTNSNDSWERAFSNPDHQIWSVDIDDGVHIGEAHIAIEQSLGDAHFSILIGRKDLWHKGYGTAATKATLDICFNQLNLYRVWVDIPIYNEHAISMCTHLGFIHEGTLRKSRPHEGSRFDSVIMGILNYEYSDKSRSLEYGLHSF